MGDDKGRRSADSSGHAGEDASGPRESVPYQRRAEDGIPPLKRGVSLLADATRHLADDTRHLADSALRLAHGMLPWASMLFGWCWVVGA